MFFHQEIIIYIYHQLIFRFIKVLIKDKLNSILFYIEFLFEKNYDIISNYFIQKLKNRNHRDTIIAIVLSLTKICDKLYNNISMLTSKKESNEIKLKIIDLSEEEKPNLLHDSKYQQIMNHLIEIIDVIYDFIVKENRNLTFSTIFTSDCVFSMITLILHCIQKGYNVSNLESILKTYKFMLELNSEWNYTNNRKLICYSIECTLTILNEFFSDKQSTKYKINSYKDDMISFLIDYSMIIREYAKDKIEDRKMIIKKFVKNIKKYIQSIEDNISNNPNIQSLIWVITRFILVICILGKLKREKSESIMDEIEIKEVMSKIENYYNNFEGVCNIQPILHFENEIKKYL